MTVIPFFVPTPMHSSGSGPGLTNTEIALTVVVTLAIMMIGAAVFDCFMDWIDSKDTLAQVALKKLRFAWSLLHRII